MRPWPCVVVGAGGHARVVIEALRSARRYEPVAATDTATERRGKDVDGVPIVGDDSELPRLRNTVKAFVVGVGGVTDLRPRERLYRHVLALGFDPLAEAHAEALVSGRASFAHGTVVLARAVINAGAHVGENAIINTGAIVEHEVRIADHVHVCPGAVVCGAAQIGEGAFVGAGAIVRERVTIGAWAVVGAGAVVLEDVPGGATVVGNPARVIGKKPR